MIKVIPKVWGTEELIINEPEYVLKRLTIKKGCHSSIHVHKTKKETFFVVQGYLKLVKFVDRQGLKIICNSYVPKGKTLTLEPETIHRLYSFSDHEDLVLYEVSTQPAYEVFRYEQ